MVINHNLSANFANRMLGNRSIILQENMEKLSSGLRINNAGDDASGLAVSENMKAQIKGLQRASQNVQDAEAFIQTAEGYLSETTDVLQRMRQLAVQSGNGIYSSDDRQLIQVEINQLVEEVDRVAEQSEFNGVPILNGFYAQGSQDITFHVGANVDQKITANLASVTTSALGLAAEGDQVNGLDMTTVEGANTAIARIDSALTSVSEQRANLGALQNRLSYLKQGLDIGAENLQSCRV